MEFLSCLGCTVAYNCKKNTPRQLPCGDSVCTKCVESAEGNNSFPCPHCNTKCLYKDLALFPINYILLDFIQLTHNERELRIVTTKLNNKHSNLVENKSKIYSAIVYHENKINKLTKIQEALYKLKEKHVQNNLKLTDCNNEIDNKNKMGYQSDTAMVNSRIISDRKTIENMSHQSQEILNDLENENVIINNSEMVSGIEKTEDKQNNHLPFRCSSPTQVQQSSAITSAQPLLDSTLSPIPENEEPTHQDYENNTMDLQETNTIPASTNQWDMSLSENTIAVETEKEQPKPVIKNENPAVVLSHKTILDISNLNYVQLMAWSTSEGRHQHANITFTNNILHLHHLKESKCSSSSCNVKFEDVKKMFCSSPLGFIDVGTSDVNCLGRIYIQTYECSLANLFVSYCLSKCNEPSSFVNCRLKTYRDQIYEYEEATFNLENLFSEDLLETNKELECIEDNQPDSIEKKIPLLDRIRPTEFKSIIFLSKNNSSCHLKKFEGIEKENAKGLVSLENNGSLCVHYGQYNEIVITNVIGYVEEGLEVLSEAVESQCRKVVKIIDCGIACTF